MDFAAIFKAENVPFVEVGLWRTHVRPGTFQPEGVLVHHTASSGYQGTLDIVRNGRPDLAGPLCNIFIARGKAHLISAGKANHAGVGAAEALNRLRHNDTPNGTARSEGYQDAVGGNALLVGFEVLSPGDGTVLPLVDWNVTCHAAAAILKHLGQPHSARVIGHAEWTRRKVDPVFGRGLDGKKGAHPEMQAIRAHVADYGYINP